MFLQHASVSRYRRTQTATTRRASWFSLSCRAWGFHSPRHTAVTPSWQAHADCNNLLGLTGKITLPWFDLRCPNAPSCSWQAYADYNDLMGLTEELISGLVKEVTGNYTIQYHADGPDAAPTTIDFSPPWVRQRPPQRHCLHVVEVASWVRHLAERGSFCGTQSLRRNKRTRVHAHSAAASHLLGDP